MIKVHSENGMIIPCQLNGISLNAGVGLGQAVLHVPYEEQMVQKGGMKKNQENELVKLDQAFDHLEREIHNLITLPPLSKLSTKASSAKSQTDAQDILNTHFLLAKDPGWKRQLREKLQEGMNALEAIDQVLQSLRDTFKKGSSSKDPRASIWRERTPDFEDLSKRLKHYLGQPSLNNAKKNHKEAPIIVVADRIGPAELLDYNRKFLVGLVLVEQSQTSHVAIVARSLDIPVVGGMKSIFTQIKSGDSLLVDGNEGRVYIRPIQEVIQRFDEKSLLKKARPLKTEEKTSGNPLMAITKDGVPISLQLNAGLLEDVDYIEAAGAEGIGLYRTEIPFMMRPKLPTVSEQVHLYQEILKRAGPHPVIFRTLDVGGDKMLPYLESLRKSESLAMERRATRVFFDRPILLRYQLRALIRACGGAELIIMLPMIAEVSEVEAARDLLNAELAREQARGNRVPKKFRLGAMIEVPSLVFQLPQLFPHVDFVSVGSNDLFQFFYAIDRGYPKLTARYDVLSSSFLSLLKIIQEHCQAAQMPLSLCGEMAGRPLEALALIGLGYTTLSMSAAAVPMIKEMIRNLNCHDITNYMSSVGTSSQGNIRQNLRHFARDHGIYSEINF